MHPHTRTGLLSQGSRFVGDSNRNVLPTKFAFLTGAPPRNQMPVIDADSTEDKLAATPLQRGDIDVRPPYAKVR